MPLDLKTKDELKVYAFYSAKIKHVASNYLDIVYDSLDSNLKHEDKVNILKMMIDWWATPDYLQALSGDFSPSKVASICKKFATALEDKYLRRHHD